MIILRVILWLVWMWLYIFGVGQLLELTVSFDNGPAGFATFVVGFIVASAIFFLGVFVIYVFTGGK